MTTQSHNKRTSFHLNKYCLVCTTYNHGFTFCLCCCARFNIGRQRRQSLKRIWNQTTVKKTTKLLLLLLLLLDWASRPRVFSWMKSTGYESSIRCSHSKAFNSRQSATLSFQVIAIKLKCIRRPVAVAVCADGWMEMRKCSHALFPVHRRTRSIFTTCRKVTGSTALCCTSSLLHYTLCNVQSSYRSSTRWWGQSRSGFYD